jgi:hypothetical protein
VPPTPATDCWTRGWTSPRQKSSSPGTVATTASVTWSASGIRDAAGNQATFPATAPADGAGPVLTAVTDTNGTIDGQLQAADTLTLTFSEALKASTVPTAPAITEARGAAGTNATLSIPGLTAGALGMGTPNYLSANGTSAVFAATATATAAAPATVKLTAGTCSSGCARVAAPATTPTMSFVPAATLTDAAGNAATGSYAWVAKAF